MASYCWIYIIDRIQILSIFLLKSKSKLNSKVSGKIEKLAYTLIIFNSSLLKKL